MLYWKPYQHPNGNHLAYAMTCALGSQALRRHWEDNAEYDIAKLLKQARQRGALKEPTPSASEAEFDSQKNLKKVTISCLPERMRYTVDRVAVTVGQPVKLIFMNPDATDHNLVIVKPGALEEVGMAANQMAKEPRFANSDFIPARKEEVDFTGHPHDWADASRASPGADGSWLPANRVSIPMFAHFPATGW